MNNPKIPRIIHQIWIGPFDPPLKWTNTWKNGFCKKFNWRYKLWTNEDIETLDLKNKAEYNIVKSFQEKADILRYEILHKFGGMYIDCDMVWLGKNLSDYIPFHLSDFIGFQEYPTRYISIIGSPYISNGIFACVANHKILKKCIDDIPERVKNIHKDPYIVTGPCLLNRSVKEVISIVPYDWVFPLDFHFKTNVDDPMKFSDRSLIFTYNGAEYDHIKKLRGLLKINN